MSRFGFLWTSKMSLAVVPAVVAAGAAAVLTQTVPSCQRTSQAETTAGGVKTTVEGSSGVSVISGISTGQGDINISTAPPQADPWHAKAIEAHRRSAELAASFDAVDRGQGFAAIIDAGRRENRRGDEAFVQSRWRDACEIYDEANRHSQSLLDREASRILARKARAECERARIQADAAREWWSEDWALRTAADRAAAERFEAADFATAASSWTSTAEGFRVLAGHAEPIQAVEPAFILIEIRASDQDRSLVLPRLTSRLREAADALAKRIDRRFEQTQEGARVRIDDAEIVNAGVGQDGAYRISWRYPRGS